MIEEASSVPYFNQFSLYGHLDSHLNTFRKINFNFLLICAQSQIVSYKSRDTFVSVVCSVVQKLIK